MPSDNRSTIEQLSERLHFAPFHRWLDLKVGGLNENELTICLPWRDEIVSNPKIGSAHGGILASLIDLTGLYTLLAFGGQARSTIDLQVDYHRPATRGVISAVGKVVRLGKGIGIASVVVLAEDRRLLASGRGAYVIEA